MNTKKSVKQFEKSIRVCISDKEHPLFGKSCQVVRIRLCDEGAWCNMDEPIPNELSCFKSINGLDEDTRRNHVLLYPDQVDFL